MDNSKTDVKVTIERRGKTFTVKVKYFEKENIESQIHEFLKISKAFEGHTYNGIISYRNLLEGPKDNTCAVLNTSNVLITGLVTKEQEGLKKFLKVLFESNTRLKFSTSLKNIK